MRLGLASAGTKTPEKQAEITTTVGRGPQLWSSMVARMPGARMDWSISTPDGAPWELK